MSAEGKWTPGPWDWLAIGANASGGHHLYIIDPSNRKIAALWGRADEKAANANLIAAAPEMAKHLQAASHALRSYQYGNSATELAQGCADQIDALLAKARGETP